MIRIYTISHPVTGEIRYVGKTRKQLHIRLSEHVSASKVPHTHCHSWIKSLISIGLYPVIDELTTVEDLHWREEEEFWIAQFRAWGFRLTNQLKGGQGPGNTWSPETIRKRADANRGLKRSAETRKRIGDSSRGRKWPEASKQQLSRSMKLKRANDKLKKTCV